MSGTADTPAARRAEVGAQRLVARHDEGETPVIPARPGDASSVQEFYDAYFRSTATKRLIQVGANDGIMCDPLRGYLAAKHQDLEAVLIEPIPFYFDRLKTLYADYPNVSVLNAACGATTGTAPLYFIDPAVADEMNGTGPANDWAHGQGSFDRDVIKYWIARNKFRGEHYVRRIDFYNQSIRSINVDIIPLADVALSRLPDNLLVVIDVQGFELDVIHGIDWRHPPAYIVFEDDLGNSNPIHDCLTARGYGFVCGRNDKVYRLR